MNVMAMSALTLLLGSVSPAASRTFVGIAAGPVVPDVGTGRWAAASDGSAVPHGQLYDGSHFVPTPDFRHTGPIPDLNAPIVGIAANANAQTPGGGYWMAGGDGGVFGFGNATFFGSLPPTVPAKPIVGIAATPTGKGYWMAGADGGIFGYGDAKFHGSLPPTVPAKPIVGIAATSSGKGYWMAGADGGIFGYGDAKFYGSLPGSHIVPAKPIVGIAATSSGKGYWMVGADGGIFGYGDAQFKGNAIAHQKTIVGIVTTKGQGYWIVASDGSIFSYGDACDGCC